MTDSTDQPSERGPDNPAARYGMRMNARPAATNLQSRLIKRERETLEAVFEYVEREQSVARAAAIIAGARRRFIAGAGRSSAFARILDHDLSLGLSGVLLIDGVTTRPLDILPDVRSTDVLIALSMRRYRRETAVLAEEFARRGGPVVVISDSDDAPPVAHALEKIIVPTASASITDSAAAIAVVVHLLAGLATASAKGAKRRLAEREKLSQHFDLY